jgi:DNA-directed RNA polymerase beta' subunit
MKLDIPNINHIVKVNELPSISSPLYLDKDGRPLSDGLYSYEIFGRLGTEQRKTQFAYVDLKLPYLHPTIYNILIKLDRSITKIISGTKWVKLSIGGYLEEAEEGAKDSGTGLDFLYKYWGKFKFKKTDSELRQEKLDFIFDFPKDEAFLTKWLIIPPHYRDIDTSSGDAVSTDILTSLYSKLIGGVTVVDRSSDIMLTGNMSRTKVQETINDIYSYFTIGITMRNGTMEKKGNTGIAGKRGLIHRSLLAKNIDYTARVVISSADMCSPKYNSQQVPFGCVGLPLHTCLTIFFPFIQHLLSNFTSMDEEAKLVVVNDGKQVQITPDNIKKFVSLFIGTQEKRTLPIKFIDVQTGKATKDKFSTILGRDFTLTDLFFILANWAVNQGEVKKHAMVTRYPIED